MRRPRKALTQRQKDALVASLLRRYRQDPARFARSFPDLAEEVRGALNEPAPQPEVRAARRSSPPPPEATEASTPAHPRATDTGVTRQEAVQALEELAAREERDPDRAEQAIAKAELGLGTAFDGSRRSITIRRGVQPVRSYSPQLGLNLLLEASGKLVRIGVDPKKRQYRSRAMSIIGAGRDTATDVAAKHDDYLCQSLHSIGISPKKACGCYRIELTLNL